MNRSIPAQISSTRLASLLHGLTNSGPDGCTIGLERTLSVMVYGGVFEKFPWLKIVSAENDADWMAYFIYRLDSVQNRLGTMKGIRLPMRASEYIKRQVYATFIADPVFVNLLDRYPADNIMWSSDYPRTAATFPRSRGIVEKRLGMLPPDQLQKIVRDTAAKVCRI